MKSEEVITLLLQRAQEVTKRKNRVALFLYVIPFIYFLFQFSILQVFKIYSVEITQIEIVNLFTPVFYSLSIFYFVYLNEDLKAIKKHIQIPELSKEEVPYFFSREYLVFPPDLIMEMVRNMKYRNLISEFGTIFIFFPLSIILLFGPILFFIYSVYIAAWGGINLSSTFYYLSIGLSIWLFLATIFYYYNRKKESKRLNF